MITTRLFSSNLPNIEADWNFTNAAVQQVFFGPQLRKFTGKLFCFFATRLLDFRHLQFIHRTRRLAICAAARRSIIIGGDTDSGRGKRSASGAPFRLLSISFWRERELHNWLGPDSYANTASGHEEIRYEEGEGGETDQGARCGEDGMGAGLVGGSESVRIKVQLNLQVEWKMNISPEKVVYSKNLSK